MIEHLQKQTDWQHTVKATGCMKLVFGMLLMGMLLRFYSMNSEH